MAALCALVGAVIVALAFAFAMHVSRHVFGVASLVGLILLISAPILVDGAAARFARVAQTWDLTKRARFDADMSRTGTLKNWGLVIAFAGAFANVADRLWHTGTTVASMPLLTVGLIIMAVAYFTIGRIVARG